VLNRNKKEIPPKINNENNIFLNDFSKTKIIKIVKKNIKKGILFPAKIIPIIDKEIIDKDRKASFLFCKFLKIIKGKNIPNIKNFCIYAPAIYSSPNGPPILLVDPSKPNRSLPKMY
tara:strand:+ start:251 stop:601 length:351 start_codon:yes stop_codon:yes gene_type:complete